jgi:hypothetical protein
VGACGVQRGGDVAVPGQELAARFLVPRTPASPIHEPPGSVRFPGHRIPRSCSFCTDNSSWLDFSGTPFCSHHRAARAQKASILRQRTAHRDPSSASISGGE